MEATEGSSGNSAQSTTFSTSSAPLWSHLISSASKSKSSRTAPDTTHPSIVPVDKTGISTRLLLHDTQLQLEKFSKRTDTLHESIASSRQELQDACVLHKESIRAVESTVTELGNSLYLFISILTQCMHAKKKKHLG
jgi:hypothetical protein